MRPVPEHIKRIIHERSGGVCELCRGSGGGSRYGNVLHARVPGDEGRTLASVVLLCERCYFWVLNEDGFTPTPADLGWILPAGANAAGIPVNRFVTLDYFNNSGDVIRLYQWHPAHPGREFTECHESPISDEQRYPEFNPNHMVLR